MWYINKRKVDNMYNTVLLKLSGEALGDEHGPYNFEMLDDLAKQIKALVKKGVNVGIVCGGGNICRGRTFEKLGMDRKKSDYVGMCATVMNAQVMGEALTNNGVDNKVFTCYPVKNVIDYDPVKARKAIKKGTVCIFGGGIGKPGYSTDTACAQRAYDIEADVILFAKNGCDGVYDKDPNVYEDAVRYDEISYDDIIKKDLQVIDIAAAKICRKHGIKGLVFDMAAKDAIKKSCNRKPNGTLIK